MSSSLIQPELSTTTEETEAMPSSRSFPAAQHSSTEAMGPPSLGMLRLQCPPDDAVYMHLLLYISSPHLYLSI